jgi:hypothetical protein
MAQRNTLCYFSFGGIISYFSPALAELGKGWDRSHAGKEPVGRWLQVSATGGNGVVVEWEEVWRRQGKRRCVFGVKQLAFHGCYMFPLPNSSVLGSFCIVILKSKILSTWPVSSSSVLFFSLFLVLAQCLALGECFVHF